MKNIKKKDVIIYALVGIIIILICVIGYFVVNKKLNNDTKENNSTTTTKSTSSKKLLEKKEYDFYGQKLIFNYYVKGPSVVIDIYNDKNELVLKDFEYDEFYDKDNYAPINKLDYFLDENGSKLLMIQSLYTDGAGNTIIDVNNKKELLTFSYGDIGAYNYSAFEDLDKEFNLNLKKYFKNDRNTFVLDKKMLAYFESDDEGNFNYVEVTINNGKVIFNKSLIKKINIDLMGLEIYVKIYDND